MNYLISGLAKSGTTILFSRLQQAIAGEPDTFFEPHTDEQFADILAGESSDTLTKVLIGRATSANADIANFDRHVLIHRDPRDQFISMLLYLFYDFQLNGDQAAYDQAAAALQDKVNNPGQYSTIELYNTVSSLVGRAPAGVFKNLHREQRLFEDSFSPFLLRYEDFIDHKLDAAEDYLGLSLSNSAQVPSEYSRVARSKSYGEWRHWLNDEDLAYINKHWGKTLSRLGYPAVEQAQDLNISTKNSLGYVAQFSPST
ncbi:MAG: hypothetical protein V7746_11105 [Halioglobus sp.]